MKTGITGTDMLGGTLAEHPADTRHDASFANGRSPEATRRSTAQAIFPHESVTPIAARQAFAHYPSGVVALIAKTGEEITGVVASSFTVGISADPPLVSVAIQRTSTSWPRLRDASHIGVSVFSADQAELARQMAGPDRAARFAGIDLVDDGLTARFIRGAATWLDCVRFNEVPAGDHTFAFLEVVGVRVDPEAPPLVFHGSSFRHLGPDA